MSSPAERMVAALAGEHAAIYGYGVLGAHLATPADLSLSYAAEQAHRTRRDALLVTLTSAGVTPPAADPQYTLPFAVTDRDSAIRLAIALEQGTAAVWRAALPDTTGAQRHTALDALVDCAVRATRWRRAAGLQPATVALPGAPTQ